MTTKPQKIEGGLREKCELCKLGIEHVSPTCYNYAGYKSHQTTKETKKHWGCICITGVTCGYHAEKQRQGEEKCNCKTPEDVYEHVFNRMVEHQSPLNHPQCTSDCRRNGCPDSAPEQEIEPLHQVPKDKTDLRLALKINELIKAVNILIKSK